MEIEIYQVCFKTVKFLSSAQGTHYEMYYINPDFVGYRVLCYICLF